MVKLQTKNEPFTAFYFKNMQDCESFMYVFKDHWCNIEWDRPIEKPDFSEMSEYQRKSLNKNPKKRAEDNLSWGFNLSRHLNLEFTDEEKSFILTMLNKMV